MTFIRNIMSTILIACGISYYNFSRKIPLYCFVAKDYTHSFNEETKVGGEGIKFLRNVSDMRPQNFL